MTQYSKFNVIYRLQKWLDSVPGQTFMNYAYSWGASIVILGTLFKLTHLPGANFMLFLGMGTEVVVFFIAAFDRPFDKTADGMELPTHVVEGQVVNVPQASLEGGTIAQEGDLDEEHVGGGAIGSGPAVVGGGGVIGGGPAVVGGGGVIGGGPAVVGGGTVIIGGGAAATPQHSGQGAALVEGAGQSAAMVEGAGQGAALVEGAGQAAALAEGAEQATVDTEAIAAVSSSVTTMAGGAVIPPVPVNPELEEATSNYVDELKNLTEMLHKVSEQSERLSRDSEEMENLNRTLTGICKIYEMQLKGASQQIGTIDEINEQTRRMAEQIAELNQIYARMIEAMTVNMPKGPIAP